MALELLVRLLEVGLGLLDALFLSWLPLQFRVGRLHPLLVVVGRHLALRLQLVLVVLGRPVSQRPSLLEKPPTLTRLLVQRRDGLTRLHAVRLPLGRPATPGVHHRVEVPPRPHIVVDFPGVWVGISLSAFAVHLELLPPEVVDQFVVGDHRREALLQLALQDSVAELVLLQFEQFFHFLFELTQTDVQLLDGKPLC